LGNQILEEIMLIRVRSKLVFASFVLALGVTLYVPASFEATQSVETPAAQAASASEPSLDYEFFKTRVEPIFLKVRSEDHARCYVCHRESHHAGGPLRLQMLAPGMSFWTEEQSRLNFEAVSKLVVPGNPDLSLFLRMPLAPEVGGIANTHPGGRQFASKDDPDWQNMRAWVMGQKAGGSSAP
jgi:hypothetical protein